ncbi:MAG: TrpB-like pyridoxal phosphate-dependent enzyme [Firmicutes bacterium]|nr:TrpB-like pyridoxal phosphate-dependent enzyme [Bacillota bacterium]
MKTTKTTAIPTRYYLPEDKMPKAWYNLAVDMQAKHKPDPVLHPGTLKPVTLSDLEPVFCTELASQELDVKNRFVDIPKPILEYYKAYRPSPLCRAYQLEKELKTPAKIFYKFEGNNTSGSHKLNSAAAQVYYCKKQGLKGVTTETGGGQWGTALSMACAFFGIDCKIFMVKASTEQKPYRKVVMETYGSTVYASPSEETEVGKRINAEFEKTGGSLGCAISEAVETAVTTPGYKYVLGSVLNHVVMHQSVIGLEVQTAMKHLGVSPDIIIGSAGGGSNFGGIIAPFMGERLQGKNNIRFIAVEPASCPSLTRGKFAYDFGDTGKMTPLLKMYTLGSGFIPSPNHAGGLRYHGMSGLVSKLYHDGLIEAVSVEQNKIFEAATLFARTETILPAPESAHAIRAAIDEALKCKESGEEKTIVFNLSGTGYFDMTAYNSYITKAMTDGIPSDADLEKGFASLPKV